MRPASLFLFALALAGISAKGQAQLPMPGGPGVEMLLSQIGGLQLTDAQVVRFAAIARRADDRHRALRTRLDSLRPRRAPGDSAARGRRDWMPGMDLFERERDALRVGRGSECVRGGDGDLAQAADFRRADLATRDVEQILQ